ncbi:hypothetical protein Leryth_022832 [Lithospermum erythrorhizon]|nr:hypothetical protein Leryth_022832 [Lithospermum erythrorhizon]
MGIVVQFQETKLVWVDNKQNRVQQFTFVDMEKIPIKVSLWEEMLFAMGPTLETAARNFSVVVAKRLTVKNYGGVSLSSKNSSSFTIDPPIEVVAELKSWFDSLPQSDLQNTMTDQSIAISKELVCKGSMEVYTVAEIDNLLESGDYWVKGFLQS